MFIIPIIILAVILILLLLKPRRQPITQPQRQRPDDRGNGLIYGETPDGLWHGGPVPDDFTPGGGDFGGAGASGEWDSDSDGDGGDGGGDGGGD